MEELLRKLAEGLPHSIKRSMLAEVQTHSIYRQFVNSVEFLFGELQWG